MPSIARLKRLQRLEARQPRGKPWADPYPAMMALWEAFRATDAAVKAGREFCPVPRQYRELGEDEQAAFDRAVRDADAARYRDAFVRRSRLFGSLYAHPKGRDRVFGAG
jgi:hypothetical protein